MTVADLGVPATLAERVRPRRRPTLLGPVALALLGLWLVSPVIPVVIASLGRAWFYPRLLPRLDAAAWAYAVSPVSGMVEAAATSLLVALLVTAIAMAAAIPAGRVLGRADFRGRRAVEALIIAPAVVPGLAVAMGLHALFLRLGLAGSVSGVVLVHLVPALPYAVLVTSGVFARHDDGYEEQARTLGAGPTATFRHVTLPLLAPGLALAAALVFLVSWSQYATTLLVGGGRVSTLPLILTQFLAAGRTDVAAVAAVLTVLPGLAVLAAASVAVARASARRTAVRGARR